jgi:hypothetical protein
MIQTQRIRIQMAERAEAEGHQTQIGVQDVAGDM